MRLKGIDWIDETFHVKEIDIDALNRVCTQICADFHFLQGLVAFNIVSDEQLWQMNMKHLNHDTLTDVITFPYNHGNFVSGEIFISVDRAKENASKNKTLMQEEIVRYAIHGVLHLNGITDATEKEKEIMHQYEDKYIKQYRLFHMEQ